MEEKLRALMADLLQLKPEQITDALAMRETETWDSLKHMEVIVTIEKTFNLELTFDEIVAMRTFGEIKRIVASRSAS